MIWSQTFSSRFFSPADDQNVWQVVAWISRVFIACSRNSPRSRLALNGCSLARTVVDPFLSLPKYFYLAHISIIMFLLLNNIPLLADSNTHQWHHKSACDVLFSKFSGLSSTSLALSHPHGLPHAHPHARLRVMRVAFWRLRQWHGKKSVALFHTG